MFFDLPYDCNMLLMTDNMVLRLINATSYADLLLTVSVFKDVDLCVYHELYPRFGW